MRGLCSACSNVDYRSFLIANLQRCGDRQEATENGELYETQKQSETFKLHKDVFEIQASGRDCPLCKAIFEAFARRNVANWEEARGLPIVFSSSGTGIEVKYDTPEGLVTLCAFDMYMDQSDGHENQHPFLEETIPSSEQIKWLSLSYCWGQKRSMMLTEQTASQLKNGTIPFNEFDPAIRDAILVTRALQITYIWIDALCIFQDDNGKDWNEQASKMNEIYGGSIVTLVVTSSDSVIKTFLNERDLEYIPLVRSDHPSGRTESHKHPAKVFLSPKWDKKHDEIDGPWSTRGWTMQEGILPNRMLYFKSSQMIWKCCEELKFERGVTESLQRVIDETLTYSDDISFGSGWIWGLDKFMIFKQFPHYLPINLDDPTPFLPEAYRLWYDLIEDYVPRHFKYIDDRLVAISGLAQIFGAMIRSKDYAAGLWKSDLVRGLLWYTEGAKLIPKQSGENIRTKNHQFPSWSWASVGYERVKMSQSHNVHFETLAEIKDTKINLVDKSQPFGAISSGSITITGRLKRISRLYKQGWKSKDEPMTELERHLSEITERESPSVVDLKYSSPLEPHFAVLQMMYGTDQLHLLVLESKGNASNGINEYYRVGVVTLRYFSPNNIASPSLLAKFKKFDDSITARLGPPRKTGRSTKGNNGVIEELRRELWDRETVVIV